MVRHPGMLHPIYGRGLDTGEIKHEIASKAGEGLGQGGKSVREKKRNFWNRHIKLWVFLILLAAAWIVSSGIRQARAAALQRGIGSQVLRFHVLANSDSHEDQQTKLLVRDGILAWLETQLSREEQNDLALMEERVEALLPEIQEYANGILKERDCTYTARAVLEETYFPRKTYGDCTFPPGNYQALRILLGEAKGQNWWCVLFPRLCFLDCVHAVLPKQSQSQLKQVLTEEEYESLFDPGEDEYRITFRYF